MRRSAASDVYRRRGPAFRGRRGTLAGRVGRAGGNHHPSIAPYGLFHSSNGVVQIAVGSEGLWARLCAMTGLAVDDPRWASNQLRVENRDSLLAAIEEVFAQWETEPLLAALDEAGIPRVTYCDPEIASVGLTEAQAREKYGEVETYEYNLGGNGKSQIIGTQGFVKLVRQVDGPVAGVHMIGARMGEKSGEAQLIVNWDAFPTDVAGLVHAHPTQNEALGEAHLALAGKPLHAHA